MHFTTGLNVTKILLLAGIFLGCQALQAASNIPPFYATHQRLVTAEIAAIDYDRRSVTLRGVFGELSFVVDEKVKNLKKVKAGDIVSAQYQYSIAVNIVEAGDVEATKNKVLALVHAEDDSSVGKGIIGSQVEVAKVLAIDLPAGTFKLEYSDGAVKEYRAKNPVYLEMSKVGDMVVITVTEALGLSLDKQPADKPPVAKQSQE